jgi:predicted protein tyrosine phosphatase
MKILVCPLSRVTEMIAAHTPELIVSVLDPEFATPEVGPAYRNRHLRLSFHDIHVPTVSLVVPSATQIHDLLAFLETWTRTAPLLIHCRAGIGRSTATAYIASCLFNPDIDEREIAVTLRCAAPLARPNETVVRLADGAMRRRGRMIEAIVDTGRDLQWTEVDEGDPFEMPATFIKSSTTSR